MLACFRIQTVAFSHLHLEQTVSLLPRSSNGQLIVNFFLLYYRTFESVMVRNYFQSLNALSPNTVTLDRNEIQYAFLAVFELFSSPLQIFIRF